LRELVASNYFCAPALLLLSFSAVPGATFAAAARSARRLRTHTAIATKAASMSPKEIPTPAISYDGQNARLSSGLPEGKPAERGKQSYRETKSRREIEEQNELGMIRLQVFGHTSAQGVEDVEHARANV
jgi:hypothetical protein